MTFDEYWEALTTKNPKLLDDVVKVKQSGLYNMLKQAFDKGYEHCGLVTRKIEDAFNKSGGNNNNQQYYADWFNDIINGGKK